MCRSLKLLCLVSALLFSPFLAFSSQETTEEEVRAWAEGKTAKELTDELVWHVLSKEKLNKLLEEQIADSKNQAEMQKASNNEVKAEIANVSESSRKAAQGFEEALKIQADVLFNNRVEIWVYRGVLAAAAIAIIYSAIK